jgi:hypothetical protein
MITSKVVHIDLDLARQLGTYLRKGPIAAVRRPAEYVVRENLKTEVHTRKEGEFRWS